MEVSITFISLFIVVFGICYLYYSTRHKERLALIERDKDVSIFMNTKTKSSGIPAWKIVILNLSLVFMGIGLGILIASMLCKYLHLYENAIFPALIFLMSGVGLLIGFFITRKMDK